MESLAETGKGGGFPRHIAVLKVMEAMTGSECLVASTALYKSLLFPASPLLISSCGNSLVPVPTS